MTEDLATSVIIVVKDGEKYLAEALDSVFASDLPPAEVIVVDGGSTDGTEAIARSHADVRFVRQQSTGIPNAYNEGIRAASNALIAFLSHDDRWDARKLRLQTDLLRQRPDVEFVVCRVRHFVDEGDEPPPGFRRELLSKDVDGFIMETLLARREVFDKVGPFDPSYPVGEDVDWFARAHDLGVPCAVVPEVLVYKRVHGGNASLNEAANNRLLLRTLRNSLQRKRAKGT